ncbi:MAG TPA: hypothetical protein DC049_00190 [Spirochaetia bacterium]|nr:hypothetical protein [Spirochaetia bacterium]
MKTIALDNLWNLAFTHPRSSVHCIIPATVPGNVELDLIRDGYISDPYPADNVKAMDEWARVNDWTYVTEFPEPMTASGEKILLILEGIDTIADVFLNGEKILRCENMFITHQTDITHLLTARNTLRIVIYSAELFARQFPQSAFQVSRDHRHAEAYIRKAAHMWGWDNAPRLLSAGIWRPVYLKIVKPVHFTDVYIYTRQASAQQAQLGINWQFCTPDENLGDYNGKLSVSFQNNEILRQEFSINFTSGKIRNITIDTPHLWWPHGYGDANLYDITISITRNNETLAEWKTRFGIREIKLMRTPVMNKEQGNFIFLCNGEKIYCRGTNWKPLDALHSRTAEKNRRALELCTDLNCNMIRVWGGGIYEDHDFFNFCDEQGLLVWQDFMFACCLYPQDNHFQNAVSLEAEYIIKKLRNHCSLALWCGDNETDQLFAWGIWPGETVPSDNVISRRVLKNMAAMHDPYRPFLESSPYINDDTVRQCRKQPDVKKKPILDSQMPEQHLYDENNYHQRLMNSNARFVSETGQGKLISESDSIIAREKNRIMDLWNRTAPADDNTRELAERYQMDNHGINDGRIMKNLVRTYFTETITPDNFADFRLAVNAAAGDGYKFAVEYHRARKWDKTGLLWWSLIEMFPQAANKALVDYCFQKKMPYFWIKQAQQTCVIVGLLDEKKRNVHLYAVNDSLREFTACLQVSLYEVNSFTPYKKIIIQFSKNSSRYTGIKLSGRKHALFLFEWEIDNIKYFNHCITGFPPYDFNRYKEWCAVLDRIYRRKKK